MINNNALWHATSDTPTPCPPLTQSLDVDVAIVGGGYTGLWTALWLSANEARANVAAEHTQGAVYTPHVAVVHPRKLVLGLRAAVLERGIKLYEYSNAQHKAARLARWMAKAMAQLVSYLRQ